LGEALPRGAVALAGRFSDDEEVVGSAVVALLAQGRVRATNNSMTACSRKFSPLSAAIWSAGPTAACGQ
jgi:hypothetical protein